MPLQKRRSKQLVLRVRDLMVKPPMVLLSNATIDQAGKVMWEMRIGSVLVTNKNGKLLGIVTERDLIFSIAKSMIGKKIPVKKIMARNVIVVSPEENIDSAIEKMRQSNISHLPVIGKDGKPVGIVSMHDLINTGAALMRLIIES